MRAAQEQLLGYYASDPVMQSKTQFHLLAVVVVKDKVYTEEVPL
jgi:hypothetical protein